jgi:hypothetical protein
MANKENRSWFIEKTGTESKRGKRFYTGDRPDLNTYTKLINSILYKAETGDRAKEDSTTIPVEDLNGHVVAATDAQAKALTAKPSDRTLTIQPSQLPEVLQALQSIGTITDEALVSVSIETGGGDSDKRNRYIVKLSDNFITYLGTLGGSGGVKIDDADTLISNKLEDKLVGSDTIELEVLADTPAAGQKQYKINVKFPSTRTYYVDNTNPNSGDGSPNNPFNTIPKVIEKIKGVGAYAADDDIPQRLSIKVAKTDTPYTVGENLWYNVDWHFEEGTKINYTEVGANAYIFNQALGYDYQSTSLVRYNYAPNVYGGVEITTTTGLFYRNSDIQNSSGLTELKDVFITINKFETSIISKNVINIVGSRNTSNGSGFRFNFTSNNPVKGKLIKTSASTETLANTVPMIEVISTGSGVRKALVTFTNLEIEDSVYIDAKPTPAGNQNDFYLEHINPIVWVSGPTDTEFINCKIKNYSDNTTVAPTNTKGISILFSGTLESFKIDNCVFEPLRGTYTHVGIAVGSNLNTTTTNTYTTDNTTINDFIITNNRFYSKKVLTATTITKYRAIDIKISAATVVTQRGLFTSAFNNNIVEQAISVSGTDSGGIDAQGTVPSGAPFNAIYKNTIESNGDNTVGSTYASGGLTILRSVPVLVGSAIVNVT